MPKKKNKTKQKQNKRNKNKAYAGKVLGKKKRCSRIRSVFNFFVFGLFCLKPCGVSDELSIFDWTEKRFFGFGRAKPSQKTSYLTTVFVVSSLIQLEHDFVGAVVAVGAVAVVVAVAVAVAELA